jgi:hypothetical protein
MVGRGLSILQDASVIEREPSGRSTLQLTNYNEAGAGRNFPPGGYTTEAARSSPSKISPFAARQNLTR